MDIEVSDNTCKSNIIVIAMYHFTEIVDITNFQKELQQLCQSYEIQGNIILANEGINGTISGMKGNIEAFMTRLREFPQFSQLEYKQAISEVKPFHRLNIRIKQELITMKCPAANPNICKGEYVKPKDWNALLQHPDSIAIDTRNDYEVVLGSFHNAINPNTKSFSEFKTYADNQLSKLDESKSRNILLFCTGGIRTEKATAYLKYLGFNNVYHLQGGILKYLEEVPKEESLWNGNCFVFDSRVSVGHGLTPSSDKLCFACRYPLTLEDQQSEFYEEGVQCKYCYDNQSPQMKEGNIQRQLQMQLAKQNNEPHIGDDVNAVISSKRFERHKSQRKVSVSQEIINV